MQLNSIQNDQRLIRQVITSLISQRAFDSKFRYKRQPENWSVEEIIHHIILVKELVGQLLEKLLQKHQYQSLKPEKVVEVEIQEKLENMDFDRILAELPAIKGTEPSSNFEKSQLLDMIDATEREFDRLITIGKKHNLSSIRFTHPYFGRLSYYEWLYFDMAHTKGHLHQIEKLGLF